MTFKIYGKTNCVECDKATALLHSRGLGYEYVNILQSSAAMTLFREKGWKSVPQIFFDDEYIVGGFEGLKEFLLNTKDNSEN